MTNKNIVEINLRNGDKNVYNAHDLATEAIEQKLETAYGELGIKISVDEIEDGEKLVDEFYRSKGYEIYKVKQKHYETVLDPKPEDKEILNMYLQKNYSASNVSDMFKPGCPDFLAVKWSNKTNEFNEASVEKLFFVEAKHKTDQLRPSQIDWIFHDFFDVPVRVCFTYPPEEIVEGNKQW